MVSYIREGILAAAVKLLRLSCEEVQRLIRKQASDMRGVRDWKQSEAEFKPDYPKSPITVIDIPLWSTSQQDEFVSNRVRLHQDAETAYAMGQEIAPCTPEERWLRPTKYAVMKKGRKRAIKLHDNETEAHGHAETLGKDHSVELRKGEAVRCEKYCPVTLFCPQFQKEKK